MSDLKEIRHLYYACERGEAQLKYPAVVIGPFNLKFEDIVIETIETAVGVAPFWPHISPSLELPIVPVESFETD